MPHHIKSKGALGSGDIYYKADDTWTQVYADRKQFSAQADADAVKATSETRTMKTPSGTIVSSYSYQPDIYKNSTVVTE